MLEEFYLYSELGEGIMKLVREVTITLLGIEQKTRIQSNITDFSKKTD